MQDQCVGFDHIDSSPAFIDAVAIVQLDGAEIGEEQGIGRQAAYLE